MAAIMSEPVTYTRHEQIATITMDDGKVNSLTPDRLSALMRALDQAEADKAVVIFTGRDQRFCAGYDLKVIMQGGAQASQLVMDGFRLLERLLCFPTPVVIASTGHAMAMGSFLLLAADVRIGVAGPYKYGANEVAIGMTLPYAAIELCRMRLAPTHIGRAAACAEIFSPEGALAAGFLDKVVAPEELRSAAEATALALSKLNMAAYVATKERVRAPGLKAYREAMVADASSWVITS